MIRKCLHTFEYISPCRTHHDSEDRLRPLVQPQGRRTLGGRTQDSHERCSRDGEIRPLARVRLPRSPRARDEELGRPLGGAGLGAQELQQFGVDFLWSARKSSCQAEVAVGR
jgi:hypothetical protein